MEKHTTSNRRIIICPVTILTLGAPTAHGERLKAKIEFEPRTVVPLVTLRLDIKCALVPADVGDDEDGVLDVTSIAGVSLKQNNTEGVFETVASVSYTDQDDPKLWGKWNNNETAVDAHLDDNSRLLEVNVTDPVKEHTGDFLRQIFVDDGEEVKTLSNQDTIGYKKPDQDIFLSELRRLKLENEAQQQNISTQQQEIVLQKEKITDLEKKESTKVSFSAVRDNGASSWSEEVSSNTVIVFNKTLVNIGEGYDNSTGVFTAPVAGTYYLRYDMQVRYRYSDNQVLSSVNLLLNGARVTYSYMASDFNNKMYPYGVMGAGLVLQLNQGDKLSVDTWIASRFYWKYHDAYASMFTGYLLK